MRDAAIKVIRHLMELHHISPAELVASDEAELEAMTNEDNESCDQESPCGWLCTRKVDHKGIHVAVAGLDLLERW